MKKCLNCEKEYLPKTNEQKYCSRSCAAISNNKLFPRNHKKPFKRPKTKFYVCFCGKDMDKYAKKCRKCHDKEKRNKIGELSLQQAKAPSLSLGPATKKFFTFLKNSYILFL